MNYLITILSIAGFFAVFLTLLDLETTRKDARNKAAADDCPPCDNMGLTTQKPIFSRPILKTNGHNAPVSPM